MSETPPEFDPANLTVVDSPAPDGPADDPVPNHTASRDKRTPRSLFRAVGDKADTPPRKQRVTAKKAVPRRKGMFIQPLTQMYTTVGILLMPFDPVCSNAVLANAENCAKALDDLAYNNDAMRRVLYGLIQTSQWGLVIAAHAPILFAVAMHHVPAMQRSMALMGEGMAERVEDMLKAETPEDNSGE